MILIKGHVTLKSKINQICILAILSNQYNTCALNNFSTILFALNHDKEKSISDFSMCVYIQFQCASLVPD